MKPPGTTTDPAVALAEKRYADAIAEEERIRARHHAATLARRAAEQDLDAAHAAAWASAEVSYEDAQAWLQAHPDVSPEQVPMGVIKAALRAHGGRS